MAKTTKKSPHGQSFIFIASKHCDRKRFTTRPRIIIMSHKSMINSSLPLKTPFNRSLPALAVHYHCAIFYEYKPKLRGF